MFVCGYLHEGIGSYFGRSEETGGGWIRGFIAGLQEAGGTELYYAAFEKADEDRIETHLVDGIHYALILYKNKEMIRQYMDNYPCDVYHLFGIENEYVYDLIPYLDMHKTLVYIQGIIDVYKHYYYADYDRFHKISPLFRLYMYLRKKEFEKRQGPEQTIMREARYTAGRTDWDEAYVRISHSQARYFHLNESLRDAFYTAEPWTVSGMDPHTVFVTQANYSIKAPHMIVEIIRLLKKKYPDVKCYIGGENLMKADSAATKLGISYASYIQKLIREYKLEESIIFLGSLKADEVVHQLQKANVFLSASSIENSPNSLQEAMLAGTPSISSFVGGVPTLVQDETQCMLYPFNDPEQAAFKISRMFDDPELCARMSQAGRERIRELTDIGNNGRTLKKIYETIMNDTKEDRR